MRNAWAAAGLLLVLHQESHGDVATDSTVVAFELRRELSAAGTEAARERLDLTLAEQGEEWRASVTARIPLHSDALHLRVESGHLSWAFPVRGIGGLVFYGENRASIPQDQLALIDLSEEWAGLRGLRFLSPAIPRARTAWAIQLASTPGVESRSLLSFWLSHRIGRLTHRVSALRLEQSSAGDSIPAHEVAVSTLAWRPSTTGPIWKGELGLSSRGGWAYAFEVRAFRLDAGVLGVVELLPSLSWVAPNWSAPAQSQRRGRERIAVEIRALPWGIPSRLLAERASPWGHRPWAPRADHLLEVEVEQAIVPGVDCRVRGTTGRDSERVLAVPGGRRVRTFDSPVVQHDLLIELRGGLESAWARAQIRRAWVDDSTVLGTEWGARLTTGVTAIGRVVGGIRGDSRARTAHLAMLQATPHPQLQVELQIGMFQVGDMGTLTEDASLFDPAVPEQRARVVLRGAFD